MKIKLTKSQTVALEKMRNGANIFLTGEAGTGKSFVLNTFLEEVKNKNILITAPTGVAAVNIGGCTLHRVFKAPISVTSLIQEPKSTPDEVKMADILIIDEISMCRIDLFDYVMKKVELANKWRSKKGYKDIQIILCGDFFQLPPVARDEDLEVLNKHYHVEDLSGAYAFMSPYWKKLNIELISLNEVVRQKDEQFVNALNLARKGDFHCIQYFDTHKAKKLSKAIYLCATNKEAKEINESELRKLKSPLRVSKSRIKGDIHSSDYPTEEFLNYKVGCRVLLLKNDKENRYVNGDVGTITSIDDDDGVNIKLDNKGIEINVSREKWVFEKPKLVEVKKGDKIKKEYVNEKIGTFEQLPFRLAYAITIHKSQGMTYDKMNLKPYSFSAGQLYVGLSRARNIENLHITNKIKEEYLITSPEVLNFYQNSDTYDFFKNGIVNDDKQSKTDKHEPPQEELENKDRDPFWGEMIVMRVPKKIKELVEVYIQEQTEVEKIMRESGIS